jgi:hypothetical protein
MSIAGIASSLFPQLNSLQNSQTQQLSTEFQQLTQDLQTGNLTQSQTDFTALQKSEPAGFANSGSPLAQELNTLGSALQSGNLPAAQQDFANVQQTVQQNAQLHHHHHHGGGASPASSTDQNSPFTQMLDTLGQDLQTGNLTQAQQAYSALTQNLQLFGTDGSFMGSTAANSTAAPASNFSVSV